MEFVYEKSKLKSLLILSDTLHTDPIFLKDKTLYKIIWIVSGKIELIVNHQRHIFKAGEVITLSYLHNVELGKIDGTYQSILFNDNFYHIVNNDHEVLCNGLLFNGSPHIVKFDASKDDMYKLSRIADTMIEECTMEDRLQGEMLRILLKRLIIICCRMAHFKHGVIPQRDARFEVMRKFYTLVDAHFKEKKQVQEYADMLNKSPKTLANILSTYHQPSAIRIIHNRVVAEAERLLHYTSKSSKEIAGILGFEDHASFSRFFRNATGQSATEFRQQIQ
ncbi:AraC-like DNA-binding protein [Parabacteroides sp. PF5-5]|uniref:AraC family transcriptional regulator n=1 Tax=unclassified Parabacteroides TaxID=2649774 RepID=UPI0024770DD3|nr:MULTISPECIES: helix-turn-helix domain-containing protein [unclassified Parabacteroides]MDH6304412.1 AraC-like DNA-binding protein [Parabacteroides sp. PH5-39]MDH6315435.1 AraC-like DNA-binding protein [Parabacteroides sp. PF5-13]MDH6319071.1 AraC-like DNA-binding protein [Parabacteroides sp. PH5-13]MDH6322801.1 AraC-like DNA-binding protein [Parabacteroides sp. PH5-8]MDH6326627.1 AraC-like DNA-binding protein [Parabacteroides sp. PH5-41]